jgi:uncharacterized lipoprotein YajG
MTTFLHDETREPLRFRFLLPAIAMIMLLAGCATSRSVVEVQVPVSASEAASTALPPNGKSFYINSVKDNRIFQEKPSSPNIPSMDPSEASSDSIKLRAVGRKRNTYGKALGDILLKEGDTTETLIASSVRKAFTDKGYKVLEQSEKVPPDAYVVDVEISQFWAWMNPGFWALTLSAEIATDISIKSGEETQKQSVQVKSSDHFQTGMESNYIQVISDALKQYIQELKLKLQ